MTSRTALFVLAGLLTMSGCATQSTSKQSAQTEQAAASAEPAKPQPEAGEKPHDPDEMPMADMSDSDIRKVEPNEEDGSEAATMSAAKAGQRQALPQNPGDTIPMITGQGVDLRPVDGVKFNFRNLPKAGLYYITSADQWPVEGTAPKIDFAKYDVLLAVEGSGSSQRKITMQDASQTSDTVLIPVYLEGPGKDCTMTQDLVPTFAVARMPKTDKKVRFQVANKRQDCSR